MKNRAEAAALKGNVQQPCFNLSTEVTWRFKLSCRKEVEQIQKEGYGIKITADSRYKLYVNGEFVGEGPQKALDVREWYVDSVEIGPYLHPGMNAAAVEVLRFPQRGIYRRTGKGIQG